MKNSRRYPQLELGKRTVAMEEFLPSVIAHSPEELAEVVVADNGSTDASTDMLEEKIPVHYGLSNLDRTMASPKIQSGPRTDR